MMYFVFVFTFNVIINLRITDHSCQNIPREPRVWIPEGSQMALAGPRCRGHPEWLGERKGLIHQGEALCRWCEFAYPPSSSLSLYPASPSQPCTQAWCIGISITSASPRDQGPALGPEASQSKSVNWEEGGRKEIKRKWGPLCCQLPVMCCFSWRPRHGDGEEEKELPSGKSGGERSFSSPRN